MHAIADLAESDGLADGDIFENFILKGGQCFGFDIFADITCNLMDGSRKSYKFLK
ncbi:hypothetical protein D3C74_398560 [compost metagenome]